MTQTGAETSPKTLHRFLTFRVGEARYALPAEEVSEIIAMPTVSRLPHSPRALLGMANLRGDVIAVASLRNLLELPSEGALEAPGGPRGSARAIVLQGASPVALAIDAVDALVSLEATNVETRPAEVSASPGEMLRGIFQLGASKDTAKILDIQGLLAKTFTPRAISRNTARPTGPAQVFSAQEAARERLVSFEVAQQDYALPLAEVAEIIPLPPAITPVAQSQAPILGIIPHRGRLLPLVSLRFLLGLPLAQAGGREKIIITAIAGVPVGLVADRMRAMLRAEPERIQPMPAVLAARTGGEARIKAIYHAEDGLVAILDTGKLFGDEVMNRLGKAVDTAHASEPTAQASIQKFLVFRLGAEEFGLPIGAVDEVVAVPEKHTKLPKTPKFLEGVTNLRGEVLPVIDQRRRFDLPPYEGDERRRRLIVVRTARHRAGLIVDAISEILAAPEEAIGEAPNLVGEPTRLVHGVINLKATERMVLLLDPDELLTRTERGLLDAFAATTAPGLINLLVVDDSALMRKLLGKIFAAEADFHLRFARNGMEALEEIRREKPDVVTLDIHMPDMDGLTCLDRIMVEQPCPVVMFSALSAEGAAITLDALRRGAVDFVAKPSGAVSLEIDALSAELVAKVRAASMAHLRGSLRLKERVRYRIGGEVFATRPKRHIPRSTGDGLVLVGTSTGGPPALEALLVPLPGDFPWPIVVVQHMPESFTGPLARRLDGLCALSVTEVQATSLLRPACVYIARGDADILISSRSEGLFAVSVAADRDYPWHPSTDRLVRSALREVAASQLIGILMTGMGDDGAQAMADLHAQGGKTIAEAEETAVVWGMPGELVKAGGADWVLPLPAIAARLQRLTP